MFFVLMAVQVSQDSAKLDFIYVRFKKLMLHKAFLILRDRELAQDAVSEAFIRVYKNLHKIDETDLGKTAAFLIMIVKNVSITLYHKQQKTIAADAQMPELADRVSVEDTVVSDSGMSELLKIIDSLKEELKTPFLLKYAYDYSLKEISRMLDISESNVAVRIHRAKAKLEKIMQKEEAANG
jgi:RNA polymerase sigma-70 factor (ECF subfamily)